MKKIILGFFLGILLSGIAFFIFKKEIEIQDQISPTVFNQDYPLLSSQAKSENTSPENIEIFKDEVSSFLLEYPTIVSFYFRDLNNGPWFSYNAPYRFEGASLNKVPIMITFFKVAEENPEFLQEKILYENDIEGVYEGFDESLIKGDIYTIEELIRTMIIESDNTSYSLLADFAEKNKLTPSISDTFEYLGLDKDENFVTVTQYASMLRTLYNAEYLNMEMSSKALEIMTQAKFENGISKYLPDEIKIAHKYGVRWFDDSEEKQIHDCGIIYKADRPYILCVMTRGDSIPRQEKIISNISKMVFELLNN